MKMTKAPDIVEAFKLYNVLIYKYIFVRVGWQKSIAEDLAQDVFLKAWKYRHQYDGGKASLKTWLFTITINTIRDYFRTAKKAPERLLDSLSSSFDLHRSQQDKQLYEYVLQRLEHLSESDQEILVLRYVQDLSVREVAPIIGKSYTATKVALHRAVKKLQEECNEAI